MEKERHMARNVQTLNLDQSTYRQLKALAASEDRSIVATVRRALAVYAATAELAR